MTVFINPSLLPPAVSNKPNKKSMVKANENPLYENLGQSGPNDGSRLDAVVSSGAAIAMKNQFEASMLLASAGTIVIPATPINPIEPTFPSDAPPSGVPFPSASTDDRLIDTLPLSNHGIGLC